MTKLKLTGIMAEHAKNKAAPGIILPKVKDHMLKAFGWDADRDPTVIHPSELAKADWCPLATYRRIVSGAWPPDPGKFDFVRENIFATGNDIHAKWQDRMSTRCSRCGATGIASSATGRSPGLEPPDETSEGHVHIWRVRRGAPGRRAVSC